MDFIGSAFAGVMGGLEKGYKFGGEIVKDLRLNEFLKQTAQTPGEVGGGGGESTGSSTPTVATPYSAGGDKPTSGAPYVQEKPAPPPPGMDAFARKGKPIPPGIEPQRQEYQPPMPGRDDDPTTGYALPGLLPALATGQKPAFIPDAKNLPTAQGAVPAFVPQSLVDIASSWGAGPPKPGDVRGNKVYTGVGWVPATQGVVTPGTTTAIQVPP